LTENNDHLPPEENPYAKESIAIPAIDVAFVQHRRTIAEEEAEKTMILSYQIYGFTV
jgi:hypothetical protein